MDGTTGQTNHDGEGQARTEHDDNGNNTQSCFLFLQLYSVLIIVHEVALERKYVTSTQALTLSSTWSRGRGHRCLPTVPL